MNQLHVVDGDVAAAGDHPLAGEQLADTGQRFLQQGQRGADARSDLPHPRCHSVTDTGEQPAGVQPLQDGQFHGQQGRIAQRGRDDADSDGDALRTGQRGCGRGESPSPAEILHDPELIHAGGFEFAGELRQLLRSSVPIEHRADHGFSSGRQAGRRARSRVASGYGG